MKNRILWVDDIRNPPSNLQCDIARNYDEAINLLTNHPYDILYLDHDLADFTIGRERTGYDIVLWLANSIQDGFIVPKHYELLTANPVGRKNMQSVIDRYLIGNNMNSEPDIKIEEPNTNLSFELVIGKKDGSIDNASVPVRWCLTKELLDSINTSDYKSPQILIQVEYKGVTLYGNEYTQREERFLFPLNQFIAYVPLSKPGLVIINAFLVGLKEGEVKCYSRSALGKDDGEYIHDNLDTRTYFKGYSLVLSEDITIDIISKSLDYRIQIPEEIFGKKPPTWLWNLINRYQDKDLEDQCSLRRRYMFFPIKLIFIFIEAFIRLFGIVGMYLLLLLCGFVRIDTTYMKHPLTYWWNCYHVKDITHIMDIGDNKFDTVKDFLFIGFKIFYRIPIVTLISMGLMYASVIHTSLELLPTILLILVSPMLLFVIVSICGGIVYGLVRVISWISNNIFNTSVGLRIVNWISYPFEQLSIFLDDISMKMEDKANKKHRIELMKLEKYLTCNNDPHSVTAEVDAIPLRDQTPRLIYTNIKNKVCKPLSR